MASGWVKVDRNILDSWIWDDVATFRVWMYLLLKANHEDRQTMIGGKLVTIKRGECFTSIRNISEKTGVSEKKVRASLVVLEGANEIVRNGQTMGTTITLVKYDDSQYSGQTIGQTMGITIGQTTGQTIGQTRSDKQEYKEKINKNKEKEKYSTSTNTRSEYGEYKNISLTGEEYGMLIGEFGLEATKQKIAECSQWKNQKNVPYRKSDYAMLRKWLENSRDKFTEPPKRPLPEPIKEEPAEEEDTVANMSDDEWVRWMNENYKG